MVRILLSRQEGRNVDNPLYIGASLSFEDAPLFVVEGFNRYLVSVQDSRERDGY